MIFSTAVLTTKPDIKSINPQETQTSHLKSKNSKLSTSSLSFLEHQVELELRTTLLKLIQRKQEEKTLKSPILTEVKYIERLSRVKRRDLRKKEPLVQGHTTSIQRTILKTLQTVTQLRKKDTKCHKKIRPSSHHHQSTKIKIPILHPTIFPTPFFITTN